MRVVVIFFAVSLYSSICFGQADTSKVVQHEPVDREISIPGIDTPMSGPGLTAQVPFNSPPPTRKGDKKRKTLPPSDPRAFGVALPLEQQAPKRDTLRN